MDTTTIQKHVGATGGVHGKKFGWGGAQGGGDPIVLAAIEVKKM
jgi:hypothetical protein